MNQTELVNQIAAAVQKVLEENAEFSNDIHPRSTKDSASITQKNNDQIYGVKNKISASTQPAWKKEEGGKKKVSAFAQIINDTYKL